MLGEIGNVGGLGRAGRIIVDFAGPGAGTGPLTWGQHQIWAAMRATDSAQSLRAVLPLPPGRTAEDLAAELGFFLSRYGSMRSRVVFADDGSVSQTVAASGEAVLTVLDVRDDADPARVAEDLADLWEHTKVDYAAEWPMRLAAVRHRGVATHVVVVLCHLAADGGGVAVMMDDLADWVPGTDPLAVLLAGPGPLELAAQQATPAARRQSDRALEYWERLLRTAEPMAFPAAEPESGPRFRQFRFDSPAMLGAARVVAHRTGAGLGPVLLAAYGTALARATGANPVLSQVIVGNRFRPGLAAAVHPVSQNGLVLLDVVAATFDDVVERAVRASVLGAKHAYYDPAAADRLLERVGPVEIGWVFNDRSAGTAPAGPAPSEAEILAAAPRRTLRWGEPLPLFNERLMVTVEGVDDSVALLVELDTHTVPAAAAETFALDMESVLIDAALNPAVPAPARPR